MNPTDIEVVGADLYMLPVHTRQPYSFGSATLTSVVCARVRLTVRGRDGRLAIGWGETPLNVGWVWPHPTLSYDDRLSRLQHLCRDLASAWTNCGFTGHALEIGSDFQLSTLHDVAHALDAKLGTLNEPIPHLAALVCCSPFDLALHDAYGMLHGVPVYDTYAAPYLSRDLSTYFGDDSDTGVRFAGKYPADYLVRTPPQTLPVWHSVGGADALTNADLRGDEPDDGYPVTLENWIVRDGIKCLKVKLKGQTSGGAEGDWDYWRVVQVGEIGARLGCEWLCLDFNCTCTDTDYVTEILDRLLREHPAIWRAVLYVEQPFPYDLEATMMDVHAVSARKPLFMDESAHDWRIVKLGRSLGWSCVALKACKTQTGAILSACWAIAHRMPLMVQDLTNPMLAQIGHVQLAAHVGAIMGIESNGPQYYPDASAAEAAIHPGIYRRRNGCLELSSVTGWPGLGYRVDEIGRSLPEPIASVHR
ncbi:MAG TPA: enolase C-terminal domain-like protein [Capsulimonadaceae bacterium]|jgi:L-alanine-DL-glutamate epimerase-like enolase superfamily enzyme